MPPPNIGQIFQKAVTFHQAGLLSQAEPIYRQILAQAPEHADALHLLGLIAVATGHLGDAVNLIGRAISYSPAQAIYHANLGVAFHRLGRDEEALACLMRSVALDPNSAENHFNLGEVFYTLGRNDEAMASCRKAMTLRPEYPEAQNVLGIILADSGQEEQAIACYRAALVSRPGWAEACNNLGCAFLMLDRLREAEESFRRAIALRADYAMAHENLTHVLGSAALARHAYEEAIPHFLRVKERKPDYVEVYANLAACFGGLGRFAEAGEVCREAIARRPDFAAAHWNLSLLLLLQGHYAAGWREYEWRWQCPPMSERPRVFATPQWDGSPAPDRTILLHAEQGFGDAIQFLRYLPVVRERACGARLVLDCMPSLIRLLAETGGWDAEIFACESKPDAAVPPHDFHVSLLSLPLVLGMPEPLSVAAPYLRAGTELREVWKQRLGPMAAYRVGIAWEGNPKHRNDRCRSIPFGKVAEMLRLSGVNFFSLQLNPNAAQAQALAEAGVFDLTTAIGDFADTAAMMDGLDLIITVDTAVAHLAGAIGKPVWTLLPFVPDWRWGLEKDETPWYPTMRLFRQPRIGDWEAVIAEVRGQLESFVHSAL